MHASNSFQVGEIHIIEHTVCNGLEYCLHKSTAVNGPTVLFVNVVDSNDKQCRQCKLFWSRAPAVAVLYRRHGLWVARVLVHHSVR